MSIETEAAGLPAESLEDIQENIHDEEPDGQGLLSWLVEVFQVRTGVGEIKEYQDSPLCFDGSEGLAQMLRGAAGFLGADFLRSAVLDIVIGAMKWVKGAGANVGA